MLEVSAAALMAAYGQGICGLSQSIKAVPHLDEGLEMERK